MSVARAYDEETQKILDDFLEKLGEDANIDAEFLAELREMVGGGTLDDPTRIRQAVANLKAKADELHD
jgi:hypothetical protein